MEERVILFKNKHKMSYQETLSAMSRDKTLIAKQVDEVNFVNVLTGNIIVMISVFNLSYMSFTILCLFVVSWLLMVPCVFMVTMFIWDIHIYS